VPLVLTGGHRPSGAVLSERPPTPAASPVRAVNTDTVTAIDRAEGSSAAGGPDDARTVERMAELLAAHVDVDALV